MLTVVDFEHSTGAHVVECLLIRPVGKDLPEETHSNEVSRVTMLAMRAFAFAQRHIFDLRHKINRHGAYLFS
jgi:hypothetical protein